jgi:plastocyanin
MITIHLRELSIAVTLVIAVTALVVALEGRGGPSGGAEASDAVRTESDSGVFVAAFQPKGRTVAIENFAYDPDPVRVEAGEAVIFENFDAVPHTVTARDGSWDSGTLAQGDAVVLVFDEPGTYEYICALHPPGVARITGAPEGAELAGGGGRPMQGTIIIE